MRKTFYFIALVMLVLTAGVYGQNTTAATAKPAAETAELKKRPPIFRPTKDQIAKVQKILKDKKLYNGASDGKYNDETREGIKSFQKGNGLKQTGTLNRATLEAFGVELTDKQKEIPANPNSYASAQGNKTPRPATGSSATGSTAAADEAGGSSQTVGTRRSPIFKATPDQIREAQRILKRNGMYSGDETGKLDDDTRAGLKLFQEKNNVRITGTLNAVTLQAMGIELTEKQKEQQK